MALNKFDLDQDLNKPKTAHSGTFHKEVGSLHSTAHGDGFLRENPEDFNQGQREGSDSLLHPAFIEITFVAKAVDDGVIEDPASAWNSGASVKPSNVHKIGDAIRRTRQSVSQQIHSLSDGVKAGATQVSQDLKSKALHVGDEIKTGVSSAHGKVKANPYPYALGAVAVGFIIGRLYLSKKAEAVKFDAMESKSYPSARPVHTGIHV